jgi:hypothetical protein
VEAPVEVSAEVPVEAHAEVPVEAHAEVHVEAHVEAPVEAHAEVPEPPLLPTRPPSARYICIDFEANGFPSKGARREDWTLPWSNHPIQISVDVVEDGEVTHAYDAVISGLGRLGQAKCTRDIPPDPCRQAVR